MTETVGDDAQTRRPGIEWHPDAARPPFEWHVRLPTDWAVVETHPARWKRQNERIVDDYFAGRRVRSKDRKDLLRAMEDVVALAQRKKVLLTLLKPGVDDEGRIANVVLNITFDSSTGRLASMAPIRRAFGDGDTFEERTTPSGNAYGITTIRRSQQDGLGLREVVSVQGFYPMPGTTWTLVVAVTTPQIHLADSLRDMVIRCIGSVRTDATETGSAPDTDAVTLDDDTPIVEADTPTSDDAVDLVGYEFEP
ncbi:hypothetical protein [Gordonia sp. NPDC003422]